MYRRAREPVARDARPAPARRASRDRAGQRGQAGAPRRGSGPSQPQSRHRGRVGEAARGAGGLRGAPRPRRAAPRALALCAGAAGHPGDRVDRAARRPGLRAGAAAAPNHPPLRPIAAATRLAVFSNVDRSANAKHAASYAGLVPATYHSGDREAYGRITKRGSAELRAMLCEAAHQASRPTHPLHPYFAKLCAKRGYKMATIAVAHRLARITLAMRPDGPDFEVGKLNVEEGPFERTIIRRYRLTPAARQ